MSSLSPPNGSLKVVSLGEPAMVVSSEGLPVGEASSPVMAVRGVGVGADGKDDDDFETLIEGSSRMMQHGSI